MVKVLRIDPKGAPATAPLSGFIAPRIVEFATEHSPPDDPAMLVSNVMSRVWKGDDDVFLAAMVTEDGAIVGHALAFFNVLGLKRYGFLHQIKADGNVGDAVKDTLEAIKVWALAKGAQFIMGVTHRNPETWRKKYGYEHTHSIVMFREDVK